MGSDRMQARCLTCKTDFDARGRHGHQKSKAHLEAGGDPNGVDIITFTSEDEVATTASASVEELEQLESESDLLSLQIELEKLRQSEAELRAQLDVAEKRAAHFSPFAEWPHFDKPEDVIAHYGMETLKAAAEANMATENKRRAKQGLPPLWSAITEDSYAKMLADAVSRIAQKCVTNQTRWVSNPNQRIRMRTVKMVKPVSDDCDDLCYRHGHIVQIPLEGQINNGAGSIADPLLHYTMKERPFKMASPRRCLLFDCWELSAQDNGKVIYSGYCCEEHMRFVEGQKMQGSRFGDSLILHEPGAATGRR